ncbi:MAG: hypothetical protein EXS31_12150 [Pedosphaera sp.]|nr:hypothetical protein [Pedosphaera sp.]
MQKPVPSKKATGGKTRGDKLAAELRAEANHLSDAGREQAGKEFLKLFYGGVTQPAPTRRR